MTNSYVTTGLHLNMKCATLNKIILHMISIKVLNKLFRFNFYTVSIKCFYIHSKYGIYILCLVHIMSIKRKISISIKQCIDIKAFV